MHWIVLVGFMGSGKSSVGKALADLLNVPFIDTDDQIEAQEGKSIQELFESIGESGFRELEARFIRSLNAKRSMVIAVGGGLPLFHENMNYLNDHGVTIYLELDDRELTNRLLNNRQDRPLISHLSSEELHQYVKNSLSLRRPMYEQAKIILGPEDQNSLSIHRRLKDWQS